MNMNLIPLQLYPEVFFAVSDLCGPRDRHVPWRG